MDLTTNYLGLKLRTPLVPAASPLSQELAGIRRMEDAGAAAVVLYSLFEEQLVRERLELHHHLTQGTESFAEALTYFPAPANFDHGPEKYLRHIQQAKAATDIPIIASLNGNSPGGWTDYAQQIEQAGADALELNIYHLPANPAHTAADVEQLYVDILAAVKAVVTIPVAVKLSPFFSSFANFARRMTDAGAAGLVLFNRFYQPDIDLEHLEVRTNVLLSRPQALRLPLRWIAILYGQVNVDFAATSGVHTADDALKLLMAGASITQLCSVLLERGIEHISVIERHMREWLAEHEYESVRQMQGSMSQQHCPDPSAFERAQYMRAVQSYKY